jgi:hypothetical protein
MKTRTVTTQQAAVLADLAIAMLQTGGMEDSAYSERLLKEIRKPALPSADDQLVGISVRAVLHFRSETTIARQEQSIADAVKAVEKEVLRTEVGGTFRVNDLWCALRSGKGVM